jgi:small subunit ribosomal protein S20
MVDSPTVPRSKSVLKRQRQTQARNSRNKSARSSLRTQERKLRTSPSAEQLKAVQSDLDKAAAKGAIHPNKAARKKSRLAKVAAKAGS